MTLTLYSAAEFSKIPAAELEKQDLVRFIDKTSNYISTRQAAWLWSVVPDLFLSFLSDKEKSYLTTIYFLITDSGAIKIGLTKAYRSRIVELQVGSPFTLYLAGQLLVPDEHARKVERFFHTNLADNRIRGEWFDLRRSKEFLVTVFRGLGIFFDESEIEYILQHKMT